MIVISTSLFKNDDLIIDDTTLTFSEDLNIIIYRKFIEVKSGYKDGLNPQNSILDHYLLNFTIPVATSVILSKATVYCIDSLQRWFTWERVKVIRVLIP